ncbi:MAG: hypothetical protein OHK0046_09630 [Anaerolineae bacterium]
MVFLVLSVGLILVCALPLAAVFRLPGRIAPLIAAGVLACANVILTAQAASLVFQLSTHGFWLAMQAVLAVIAVGVWWQQGKPPLPFSGLRSATPTRADLVNSLRAYPLLWGFGVFVVLLYGFALYLTLSMPANEWDTLSYRLARVGYWLQHETLLPWDAHDLRQTAYPPNTELLWLWTMLGVRGGQLVGGVGWLTTLFAALLIGGMARLLGFNRAQTVFAVLVWVTLPLTLLQAVSTQNDALAGVFAVSSVYFLYLGLGYQGHDRATTLQKRPHHTGALIVSGLALGLAVGTKTTVLFFLPGYGLLVGLLFLTQRQLRPFVIWGAACVVGFALLGMTIYAQNWIAYGSPLGKPSEVERVSDQDQTRLELVFLNAPRYAAQWLDTTGLPVRVAHYFNDVRRINLVNLFEPADFMRGSFWNWIHYTPPPHETLAWFGPLGVVLFLPGLAYGLWRAWRRRDVAVFGLVMIPVVFVLVHSALLYWSPYRGRYHVPIVMLAAPLMAWPYLHRSWSLVRWLVVALIVVVGINTLRTNDLKPLVGERAIWSLDTTARSLLSRQERFDLLYTLRAEVPPDAPLGIALTYTDIDFNLDYLFFGETRAREVMPLIPADSLREMAENGTRFILGSPPRAAAQPVPEYILIHEVILARIEDTSGYVEIGQGQQMHLFHALPIDPP